MPAQFRALPLAFILPSALVAGAPAAAQTPAPAPAPAPAPVVQPPEHKVLIREGQTGRMLLGGQWYFRLDDAFVGDQQRFFDQDSLDGWTPIKVPYNWNATDTTQNRSSVGWYRREFTLPKSPKGHHYSWKVRFESANERAVVWLNGRKIGGSDRGYFPFEADLKGLQKGANRLVVKVSSLRSSSDLTHWRPAAFNGFGTGGWWNFGGLLREVYVRPVEGADIENVMALPKVGNRLHGPARVVVKVRARNLARRERKLDFVMTARGPGFKGRFTPKPQGVAGGGARRDLRLSFTIPHPSLWQPGHPSLYSLTVGAGAKGKRLSTYKLSFGVKKLQRTRDGRLLLNGRQLRLRGASIHEDDPRTGGVSTSGQRANLLHNLRRLHATVTRSHYPLHPAFLEALDRAGIMDWSQAPVYQLPNKLLNRADVRAAALSVAKRMVFNNANHPSIFVWSVGNELGGNREERGLVGPGMSTYIKTASKAIRQLDNTRMVGIDRQSRIGEVAYHPAFAQLDVMGVNEYFGWYDSTTTNRPPSTTKELGPFLDLTHKTYPHLPLVITEFGSEATRNGPVTQRGSFEFQSRYARQHLAIHASKRYINGSIYWALKDFRVDPTWLGGAPRDWATPPWHNKSLIDESGAIKPIYRVMQKLWGRTKPLR
ncbi:MAG TPA: glycoside hydrolase family 2 TIM barrel-domain containing protein [Thermoleophilaceae bacterium]